ncbi:GNAT family N-acetyltransferase [Metabacillus sp. BG109]|uniref:GNAT family N-acetyltransferase n=1 Tax=Metabacillus bambusae TaxID=2795218 RepID=A0ABS3MYK8_9BACI|nr:GNAT family N-acetyltransferase [Metabacillus bambusae]
MGRRHDVLVRWNENAARCFIITCRCKSTLWNRKRGKGIGKKVMNALLKKCKELGIKWIQLSCAKGKQNFYKKLGFVERDSAATGMSLFL